VPALLLPIRQAAPLPSPEGEPHGHRVCGREIALRTLPYAAAMVTPGGPLFRPLRSTVLDGPSLYGPASLLIQPDIYAHGEGSIA